LPHPSTGEALDAVIRRIVGPSAAKCITFTGGLDGDRVIDHLSKAAIAVLPSYWEAFGYVCLEAMSAACAVVASNAGGMTEIIEHNLTGMLVAPRSPREIADAIVSLLRSPAKRSGMGAAAREKVLRCYAPEAVAPLQEASYHSAIRRAEARNLGKIETRETSAGSPTPLNKP
jgi:glycogen(starch) synthase